MAEIMALHGDKDVNFSSGIKFIRNLSGIFLSGIFWVALFVTSCISVAFYQMVQKDEYVQVEAEFHEEVEEAHSRLLMTMNQYRNNLYEARSIYYALPNNEKSEWTRFIQDLEVLESNPGHEGLAFVEEVSGAKLAEFQQMHPGLTISPKMENRNCVVTMYSMSERHVNALGYNLCATSTVEASLLEATKLAKVTSSPPTHLFGDLKSQTAILLSLPLYMTETTPDTTTSRELSLVGWIVSPIQLQTLIQTTIAKEPSLEFQVYQGEAKPANLLFSHIKETDSSSSTDLFASRTMEIDTTSYTILYVKRDIGRYIGYSVPLIVLSVLFSLLGGILVALLYSNKSRAESLAKELAQSLNHTEDSIKKLLDTSPGAIYTHTNEEDWTTLFVSDYFYRLTGYPSIDFKNRENFDDIVHPQDLHQARREIFDSLKENEFYEVEYRILKSDGSIIWVMDKGYLEKNEDEPFVRGVIFDITKTKRIEQASHQLNNALMYMAEGISLVDRKGTFLEINPAFARVCGWKEKSVPGIQFLVMIHPDDTEEAERLFSDLQRKEKVSGELRGIRQDGSFFYMSLIFVGLYDDDHELTGAYLFVRDISERKQAEEDLRKAKEEISMAYKTKSDFLATMSQEMRSSLNVIMGYSDMLREELNQKSPEYNQDIEAIQDASKHLLALVNDIIDISKLESGQAELQAHTFHVTDLVENVLGSVASLITRNHNKLNVVMSDDIGIMNSDFGKIRQNLINLISNATNFTQKGHIELSIKASGNKQEWIHFIITDTGQGIREDELKKIFTPFARKKRKESHQAYDTGLGLPIVLRFCKIMGGTLHAKSEVGKGSTFEMIIPRGDITPEETSPKPSCGPTEEKTKSEEYSTSQEDSGTS